MNEVWICPSMRVRCMATAKCKAMHRNVCLPACINIFLHVFYKFIKAHWIWHEFVSAYVITGPERLAICFDSYHLNSPLVL